RMAVQDVRQGPDGAVWVVQGHTRGGVREGVVWASDGGRWPAVCRTSEGDADGRPPAGLNAVAFDVAGRPYLASRHRGLLQREAGRWTRLTPGWPDYRPVTALHITPAGVAVLGTLDAGVLLFNLQTKAIRRVALRP